MEVENENSTLELQLWTRTKKNGVVVESCSCRMEEKTFSYRNLIVWQKAKKLVKLVYAEVKRLPAEERYALGDQIRRAVVSVPSNVAEGFGRESPKDFMHFLTVARGSLYETRTQLRIAYDLGLIDDVSGVDALAVEVGRLLNAFISKLRDSTKTNSQQLTANN